MKITLNVFAVVYLTLFTTNSAQAINWGNSTQNPGDYTALGTVNITGTVNLNPGTYTFQTLNVNSGRTLKILSDTAAGTGVIINATTVSVIGSVNGDGTGYSGTQGTSPGLIYPVPWNAYYGGGCHGGLGGMGNGVIELCTPYGSSQSPTTLGSPGGFGDSSGAGGGAVKFNVSGTMSVTGTISMNGIAATTNMGGSGAGGSVWIVTNSLAGNGTIRANGANGYDDTSTGSGGGGRVSIHYASTTFSGNVQSRGGTGDRYWDASVGSLWWIDTVNNDLLINDNSTISNGTYNFRNITITSSGYLWNDGHGSKTETGTGAGVFVTPADGCPPAGTGAAHGGRGNFWHAARSKPYGNMLQPITMGSGGGHGEGNGDTSPGGRGAGAIKLELSGTLTVDGTLASDGWGAPYFWNANYPGGGSGGSIWIIANSVVGSGNIFARGGYGAGDTDPPPGGAGSGGRIAIYYATTYSSTLNIAVNTNTYGVTEGSSPGSAVVINTTSNDLLFPTTSTLQNGTYTFNNVTLAAGAVVTAIEGSDANTGTGKGLTNNTYGSGGGYGGKGGTSYSGGLSGGNTYGSLDYPTDLGSGGGGCSSNGSGEGGIGGGAVRFIIANTLTINSGAQLSATGGQSVGYLGCGGGSGGSIWINTKNLVSVTNGIAALGGSGNPTPGDPYGAGGGGGRIAIYYSGTYSGTLNVTGGTSAYTNGIGKDGTTTVKLIQSIVPHFFRGY
ncbi:hypothetical protein [Bdellovibrio sp. GT3]|uniref:hypothetical protein n=1 Tax=Bdellovibrio sp. GT3 TaxID=3136282 RepID=UPI0030F2ED16